MLSGAKAFDLVDLAELSNEYLLVKFGFDTTENEPLKVCQKLDKSQNKSKKKLSCLLT